MPPLFSPPLPLCFVVMPFGKKAAPGPSGIVIDFDEIFGAMAVGIGQVGLDCRRADFDPSGGFIHRSMFDAILVAEYVVVDLTFANANLAYAVGLRHGANAGRATILVYEDESLRTLPFDFRPLRTIAYQISALSALGDAMREKLKLAQQGQLPFDNPILQITNIRPGVTGHEKTDRFAQRMACVSDLGATVSEILALSDNASAVNQLRALESQVLGAANTISQLHTALLAIYLGYRAKKAWPEMVALFGKMPDELQASPVAREQLALAHNRIAEGLQRDEAIWEERRKALSAIDAIPKEQWTSETYSILGRIYKGEADAQELANHPAEGRAALSAAIMAYEGGFKSDPRDYYPGVNAVTLRILRSAPEDQAELEVLLPAVRFSVNRSPTPLQTDEAYWQAATKLELAVAARDWKVAQAALGSMLALDVASWMRETTADNLRRLARARHSEPDTQRELSACIQALGPKRNG